MVKKLSTLAMIDLNGFFYPQCTNIHAGGKNPQLNNDDINFDSSSDVTQLRYIVRIGI